VLMSVLVIIARKCTLAASRAVPSHDKYAPRALYIKIEKDRTYRRTDARPMQYDYR